MLKKFILVVENVQNKNAMVKIPF